MNSVVVPRLLLIDDEPKNIIQALNFLESGSSRFVLYSATNGKTGIEIAVSEIPDLIILDWQMEGMDGLEVLKELKNSSVTNDIPVIMYTGIMTNSDSLRKALEIGAYDFLRKPVEPIEMETRIRAAIKLVEENRAKLEIEKKLARLEIEKLESNLHNKNREATDMARFLASKNEILINVNDKLAAIQNDDKLAPDTQKAIGELVSDLKANISSVQYYEKFLELFNELHPAFSQKLFISEISFSPNELKILAFIRLNLGNKEMSSLLNVSPAAIEKSKYRLKQKLQLNQEISLNHYVLSL